MKRYVARLGGREPGELWLRERECLYGAGRGQVPQMLPSEHLSCRGGMGSSTPSSVRHKPDWAWGDLPALPQLPLLSWAGVTARLKEASLERLRTR